jgi:hypothetical protein
MKKATFLPEDYQAPNCPILERYEQSERGNRTHFIRLGITMDPIMVSHLKTVGAQLQAKGYSDTDLSSLIRCACKEFLSQIEVFFDDEKHAKHVDEMNTCAIAAEEAVHEEQHNKWVDKMNSN